MDNQTTLEMLGQLRAAEGESFVVDDAKVLRETEKRQADKAGMAIKVLSVFGGLLATCIFLSFLGIAGMYDQYQTILILGIVFIAVAVVLNKVFNLLIIDTSVIGLYVVGFCMLGYGLAEYAYSGNQINAIFISIAFVSLLIAQNFVLAFVSVLIINGCFIALILIHERLDLIHIYNSANALLLSVLLLQEPRLLASGKIISRLYRPVRAALIFSLLAGLFFVGKRWWWIDGNYRLNVDYLWLSSIVIFLAMLYLISKLLAVFGRTSSKDHIIAYAAGIPVLLCMSFLPAISGTLLIMLMSFLTNYKTGLVVSILAFIYFISQFYYDLHFTLLTKSMILFCTGVLFICCFVFTHFKWKSNEKV